MEIWEVANNNGKMLATENARGRYEFIGCACASKISKLFNLVKIFNITIKCFEIVLLFRKWTIYGDLFHLISYY